MPLQRLEMGMARKPEILADPKLVHLLEQTVVCLGFNAGGARALDERLYLLRLDDAYDWRDRYVGPETVLRHYVVNTRIKLWRQARHYLK